MEAFARTQRWAWRFRHQPLPIRLLAASAAVVTVAVAFSAPAEANPGPAATDDDFLGALSKAGINAGDRGNALSLGQTVCPMLVKPGGSFGAAAAKVKGNGISPGMAEMFTQIAIQMYCPQIMGDIASGNLAGLPKIPGVPGF